jgi:chromosome segregation ATPase
MKAVVILLGVGLMILGVLYYQECRRGNKLNGQLASLRNQFTAKQEELASVKTQAVLRVAELESTLAADRAAAGEQIGQLRGRLQTAEQSWQTEKSKVATVEDERARIVGQLTALSNELTNVRQQPADSVHTSAATQEELETLRRRGTTLEMEKALLERELNDLDALNARIRIVRRQLWKNRVEQWQRQDREARRNGNKGLLFKGGQWQTGGKWVASQ